MQALAPDLFHVRLPSGNADTIRNGQPGPPPRLCEAELALAPTTPGDQIPPAACPINREVSNGDVLSPNGEITVVQTPGYSDGSIALHWPGLGVLFTGNTLAEFHGDVILGVFSLEGMAV